MGIHRQPQDCPVPPHGDVAPRWQGAGGGRRAGTYPSRKRRTLRSGHRDLVSNRQPQHRAIFPYGNLHTPPRFHPPPLLGSHGVVAAGRRDPQSVTLTSADLYHPATGTWSATGSLNTARYDHTATLLRNGMVLVAGGNPDELDSAELYDPATGTWSVTDSLHHGRADHVETLLPNGMVVVAGGTNFEIDTAELYDPP